jgi:hypothetical protein
VLDHLTGLKEEKEDTDQTWGYIWKSCNKMVTK